MKTRKDEMKTDVDDIITEMLGNKHWERLKNNHVKVIVNNDRKLYHEYELIDEYVERFGSELCWSYDLFSNAICIDNINNV